MEWDLGAQGILVLAGMSVAFGLVAMLLLWDRTAHWVTATVASLLSFVGGLLVSEVWFGWATEEELQPNIDGLSFDEVLIAYLLGGVVVLIVRFLIGRRTPQEVAHQ